MFSVERKHHCIPVDLQKFAVRHCGCRPHAESLARKRTFSEKLSFAQYAQGCFLANLGYDSEPNLAFLDVEDCVSLVSLCEDCLFLGKSHDFPTLADRGKEFLWVEVVLFLGRHGWCCQWLLLAQSDTLTHFVRTVIIRDVHFCSQWLHRRWTNLKLPPRECVPNGTIFPPWKTVNFPGENPGPPPQKKIFRAL